MLIRICSLFLLVNSYAFADVRVKRQGETVNNDCTTPDGKAGKCVSIRICPSLRELLKKAREDPETTNFLRNSKCGTGYAEVCCMSAEGGSRVDNSNTGGSNGGGGNINPDICGKSTVRQSTRVVGGDPADLGAWPWIAALGYRERTSRARGVMWRCGGSLINSRYVLTAAHCIRTPPQLNVELVKVRLGEHDLSNDTEGAHPVDYDVERTIVHEEYRSQSNDIALVKLSTNVAFTDFIRPICLPTIAELRTSDYDRKYPFVVGWGDTQLNGRSSDVLLQVQVPVVDNQKCNEAYNKQGANITSTQLCAGDLKGGKDSCRGDSGGPLMLPSSTKYYQIGVVSFGYRCAEPGYPGVYTRVSAYLDWIQRNADTS